MDEVVVGQKGGGGGADVSITKHRKGFNKGVELLSFMRSSVVGSECSEQLLRSHTHYAAVRSRTVCGEGRRGSGRQAD